MNRQRVKDVQTELQKALFLKTARSLMGRGIGSTWSTRQAIRLGAAAFMKAGRRSCSAETPSSSISPRIPLVVIKRNGLRDPGYKSLKAYSRSLDRLAGLDIKYVFTGHGEYIRDLPGLIATYKRHHRERMDLVWNALHKRARSLYEIIGDVFSQVPDGDMFLAISEILFHLEILTEEERAELIDPGPPAMYRSL